MQSSGPEAARDEEPVATPRTRLGVEAFPASGSMQITESNASFNTYGITCTGAPPAAKTQVTVTFTNGSSQRSGDRSNGGGGNGAFDKISLLWLALILLLRPTLLHFRRSQARCRG
jgi:hypothetical protein